MALITTTLREFVIVGYYEVDKEGNKLSYKAKVRNGFVP
jgi:hypothetical protein